MNINRATCRVLFVSLCGIASMVLSGCSSTPAAKPGDTATKFAFWPSAPDEPRIQFVGAFNSSEDIAPTKTSSLERVVFGEEAVRPGFVNKPYGVACRDGKIYICDIRAKALIVMDLAKKQTRLVGVTGASRLERPIAVALGEDGQIYVADGIHSAILVYDKGERFTRSMPIPKLKPSSVAIFGNRLYVADIGRQMVLVLDAATGKEIGEIGSVGDESGQFRLPVGVSVDKAGILYVADMMQCRVQKFTPDGKFIAAVGEQGDHAGGFARPKHLAVDADGIIYVVDAAFQNVQMFNSDLKLLMHFGAAGDFQGSMNLPVGIAVSDSGLEYFADRIYPGFAAKRLIIVANQFGNGKVSVYALGERRSNYSLTDVANSSAPIETGVGTPSAEALKFQNIGGVEPGQEPASATSPKEQPATSEKTPSSPKQ